MQLQRSAVLIANTLASLACLIRYSYVNWNGRQCQLRTVLFYLLAALSNEKLGVEAPRALDLGRSPRPRALLTPLTRTPLRGFLDRCVVRGIRVAVPIGSVSCAVLFYLLVAPSTEKL